MTKNFIGFFSGKITGPLPGDKPRAKRPEAALRAGRGRLKTPVFSGFRQFKRTF